MRQTISSIISGTIPSFSYVISLFVIVLLGITLASSNVVYPKDSGSKTNYHSIRCLIPSS